MSSKRAIKRKQCAGKKPYCNMGHAEREASKARRRTGDNIQAYKCTRCGWPHIGHASARKIKNQ